MFETKVAMETCVLFLRNSSLVLEVFTTKNTHYFYHVVSSDLSILKRAQMVDEQILYAVVLLRSYIIFAVTVKCAIKHALKYIENTEYSVARSYSHLI